MFENEKAGQNAQPTTQVDSTTTVAVEQQGPFFILPTNGEVIEQFYVSTPDGSVIPVTAEEAVARKSIESVIRDIEPDVEMRQSVLVYTIRKQGDNLYFGRSKKEAEALAAVLVSVYGGHVEYVESNGCKWVQVRSNINPLTDADVTIFYDREEVPANA